MLRSKRGQSTLEYAALITVLAAVVAWFIWGNGGDFTLKGKVNATYSTAMGKIDTAKGWLEGSMK